MSIKSNGNVKTQRVQKATSLLLEGYSRQDILQFGSENWDVSERQIDSYIHEAKEFIKNGVKRDVLFDYNTAVMRFNLLYKLAINKKDIRSASMINRELATLQNLYNHPEIFNVDQELLEALTPVNLQKSMFEVPFNKFLEKPENADLKKRYESFNFMEAYLEAIAGSNEPIPEL